MKYHIASEFSAHPYGRYSSDGEFCGANLAQILKEKFKQSRAAGENLEVVFDEVQILSSGFIEEAFGGLATALKKDDDTMLTEEVLTLTASTEDLKYFADKAWVYIAARYAKWDNHI